MQPAATEATNLPGSTLLAPGLARLKITLLPHNGHALPARISLAVPVDERADTVPEMRDLSQVLDNPPRFHPAHSPASRATDDRGTANPGRGPMDNAGNAGFQPLDFGFVRRGMYNHIQTSQLVGPAADILEYNAIGRLGFSPRIRRHEYHAQYHATGTALSTVTQLVCATCRRQWRVTG